MLVLLLAILLVLFFYPFVLYPLAVRLYARTRRAAGQGTTLPRVELPDLTLVICALNEERVIKEKLENCLALDYPREKLRVVVISDGSTDRTAAVVRQYGGFIELREHAVRRGKIACLNEAVPGLSSSIVALSDANVMYHPQALRKLVACFADPTVGGASGKVILQDTTAALETSTQQYYSIEWDIQQMNSDIYSLAGADGAMYAFRRELYRPCPGDTIIEDFVIPIGIVRQGFRVVFQPEAIGWEQGVTSVREEYRRRVRIAAGAAQAMQRGNGWPGHAPARFWFVFISHKLLRWLSPVTGAAIVLVALLAWASWWGQAILALFLLLVLLTGIRMWTGSQHPLLTAPFYFLFSQVAIAVGLVRGCAGQQTVLWAKANR